MSPPSLILFPKRLNSRSFKRLILTEVLVSSLITLPVAAAMRIAKGFKEAIIYAVVFGEIAVLVGLVSAYYLDLMPGGTIVVTSILILLFVILLKKVQNKLANSKEGNVA